MPRKSAKPKALKGAITSLACEFRNLGARWTEQRVAANAARPSLWYRVSTLRIQAPTYAAMALSLGIPSPT